MDILRYDGYCYDCESNKSFESGMYRCPLCNSFRVEINGSEDNQSKQPDEPTANSMMSNNEAIIEEDRSSEQNSIRNRSTLMTPSYKGHCNNCDLDKLFETGSYKCPTCESCNIIILVYMTPELEPHELSDVLSLSSGDLDSLIDDGFISHMDGGSCGRRHAVPNYISYKCSICYENFSIEDDIKKLICGHIQHRDCIKPWLELNPTCPLCRKNVEDEV